VVELSHSYLRATARLQMGGAIRRYFLVLVLASCSQRCNADAVVDKFASFDVDNDGIISRFDMSRLIWAAAKNKGTSLTSEEIDQKARAFVKELDQDGDGNVTFKEFQSVFGADNDAVGHATAMAAIRVGAVGGVFGEACGASVAAGCALGAGAGSFVPFLGNAVGCAAGALAGALSSCGKDDVKVFLEVASQAIKLAKEVGMFCKEHPDLCKGVKEYFQ
jgi:uncharacterized membrane protein